jgi:thymidine phosphorylase
LRPHPTATPVSAERTGYLAAVDAVALGEIARALTERDGDGAGLQIAARVGDSVEPGRTLATVYGAAEWASRVGAAFTIREAPPPPRPLIYFEIGTPATRSTLDTK